MFLGDVPSVFPSPLTVSHATSASPPLTYHAHQRLWRVIAAQHERTNATSVKWTRVNGDSQRVPASEVSRSSFRPLHPPLSVFPPAGGSEVETEVFARRTRHISMPRCGPLAGRCLRMRVGQCSNMCIRNRIRYVCRLRNRRGKVVCSVGPLRQG
ncbi:hypothetical protein ACOMHN_051773 [Nucella lapillus]